MLQILLYVVQALQIVAISTFVFWVIPSVFLLLLEEFRLIRTNFSEMIEDNRANKRRMNKLVKDAEIRWEMRMGVKTNG